MKRWLLAFLLSALLLLAGCGGTASDGASSNAVDGEANDAAASQVLTEGAEALTDDELAQAQEAFASERYDEATGANSSTEISCFFTSYYDRAEELRRALLERAACFSLKNLAVNGRDLLALGLRGPAVGLGLDACLDAVMDGRVPNRREELLMLLKNKQA